MKISIRLTGIGALWNGRTNLSSILAIFALLLCTLQIPQNGGHGTEAPAKATASVADGEDVGGAPESRKTSDDHISQVRYRSRPVPTFRSSSSVNSSNNATSNSSSSELEGSEPSRVPFFAVHDLSSQTFERLQENWRNLEALIRNLQVRRSQDESQRSSSQTSTGNIPQPSSSSTVDNRRRSPYSNNNNVFAFKYHPVVLEGQGSASVDDIIGSTNGRTIPSRSFNHFSPFPPLDAMDNASKSTDMEKHTIATIYTIGICLTIMAIGSVMFILINKCDGTSGGTSYTRTTVPVSGGANRIARGVLGTAAGRPAAGVRQNNNGRSRSSRRGPRSSNTNGGDGNEQGAHSVDNLASANSMFESDAKILTDLPPSYDSLFPEAIPSLQEVVQTQPCVSSSNSSNMNNASMNMTNVNIIEDDTTNCPITQTQNETSSPSVPSPNNAGPS